MIYFYYLFGTKEFVSIEEIPEPGRKSGSMVDWSAPIDGYVITRNMTNDQVWHRCNLFGCSRLIEAIEVWLKTIEGQNENQTMETVVSKLASKRR